MLMSSKLSSSSLSRMLHLPPRVQSFITWPLSIMSPSQPQGLLPWPHSSSCLVCLVLCQNAQEHVFGGSHDIVWPPSMSKCLVFQYLAKIHIKLLSFLILATTFIKLSKFKLILFNSYSINHYNINT